MANWEKFNDWKEFAIEQLFQIKSNHKINQNNCIIAFALPIKSVGNDYQIDSAGDFLTNNNGIVALGVFTTASGQPNLILQPKFAPFTKELFYFLFRPLNILITNYLTNTKAIFKPKLSGIKKLQIKIPANENGWIDEGRVIQVIQNQPELQMTKVKWKQKVQTMQKFLRVVNDEA